MFVFGVLICCMHATDIAGLFLGYALEYFMEILFVGFGRRAPQSETPQEIIGVKLYRSVE